MTAPFVHPRRANALQNQWVPLALHGRLQKESGAVMKPGIFKDYAYG
jgi:hypothetical protein